MRALTLGVSLAPALIASVLAVRDESFNAGIALVFGVGFLLLQVASNLVNDLGDHMRGADGPERCGPPRVAASGWLTVRQLWWGTATVVLVSGIGWAYLTYAVGWEVAPLGPICILAALAYTAGPYPYGYHGWGDAFVFVFFGPVAVAGNYYVQVGTISPEAWVAAAIAGSLATAILDVNNLRDRESDLAAGKRTLVVRYGMRFGRLEYAALLAGSWFTCLVLGLTDEFGWLLPLLLTPKLVRQIRAVWVLQGQALGPHLGATAFLGLGFNSLLALGLWISGA